MQPLTAIRLSTFAENGRPPTVNSAVAGRRIVPTLASTPPSAKTASSADGWTYFISAVAIQRQATKRTIETR